MPRKCPINWEARREFICNQINAYFRERNVKIHFMLDTLNKDSLKHSPDFVELKKHLAENYIFVDWRSIDDMLAPYEAHRIPKSILPTAQLKMNL